MVDIILKDIRIKDPKPPKEGFSEEYRLNVVEIVRHLTEMRKDEFRKHITNPLKFKIVIKGSKLPERKAPWVETVDR
ncbi:MAG: hypothetical protein ABIJ92_04435 [Candidatus Aenigmatarchaeota archaeon]